jgi:hypothetical protein
VKPRSALTLLALASTLTLALAQGTPSRLATNIKLPASATTLGQSATADWTNGTISAEGKGVTGTGLTEAQARVRARGAAIADAQRLLAAAVRGVQVTSDTTVESYELKSDTIKTKIEAFLKGVQVVPGSDKIEKLSDGSFIYSISVALPLAGNNSVTSIVAPEITNKQSSVKTKVVRTAFNGGKLVRAARGIPISVSSLVLSIRGQNFDPCLAPKVASESGTVVWGNFKTIPESAIDQGIMGYAKTQIPADRLRGRLGADADTLEVDVKTVKGTCDMVISDADAKVILDKNKETNFLGKFSVAVLVP